MSAIVDTTVLSNFAAAQRLDLLPLLWNEVYIAYPVFEEIRQGVEDGYEFLRSVEKVTYPLHLDGWLKIVFLEDPREVELLAKLPIADLNDLLSSLEREG
jgi:predicted nucleic acid-binding protein